MRQKIPTTRAKLDFKIKRLGKCKFKSPLKLDTTVGNYVANFVKDTDKIMYEPTLKKWRESITNGEMPYFIEVAGPRHEIFFNPHKTKAAIVTCGGLCPGLNDVVRSIVMELWFHYDVKNILGIRYGYWGLLPERRDSAIALTPDMVANIHNLGGSFLGSSRGDQDVSKMTDFLAENEINILFAIGGDGTQTGALEIAKELRRRKLKKAIVGIPKTIDNDIAYLDKTFGFETAAAVARDVILSGHIEAEGALYGIGLVKLMGRHSGFIAARAALAAGVANFVLVPEVPFDLDGRNGFLTALEERLRLRKHALIVIAEGAGQDLLIDAAKRLGVDPSGNEKLADIGLYLKDRILDYFKTKTELNVTLKYIDPSYTIRSAPAHAMDHVYCLKLGQNAVHSAMTGRTEMIVGSWNGYFTHIPITTAISKRKVLNPEGDEWLAVVEATGQPLVMKNN